MQYVDFINVFIICLTMLFDSSTKSPMLSSSYNMPFSSVSLHINHRAFMHIFTHVTFSYFFFRSTIVDLYLSTYDIINNTKNSIMLFGQGSSQLDCAEFESYRKPEAGLLSFEAKFVDTRNFL